MPDAADITAQLQAWVAGEPTARETLFPLVYDELRRIAHRQLQREWDGHTLDTTALVHELYLRVSTNKELLFGKPVQFFAYAARAMRHLLAARARDRLRLRAGGQWMRVTLTGTDDRLAIDSAEQALALDEALKKLEESDPRAARVVELRYFAGLTSEETAAALGISKRTADRDWEFAQAFLKTDLG